MTNPQFKVDLNQNEEKKTTIETCSTYSTVIASAVFRQQNYLYLSMISPVILAYFSTENFKSYKLEMWRGGKGEVYSP